MVGIVILNYNSWEDSLECVQSLFDHEKQCRFQIYLIDNASTISMPEKAKRYVDDGKFILIQSKENRGYAAGNNLGIKRALDDGCDAILISNSDVRYYDNSVSILYQYLQENPEVGIVGPKIKFPNGKTQKESMAVKTGVKEKYILRTRLRLFFPKMNDRYWGREHDYETEIFRVYAVLGCCFMMSRKCALDVAPLDENTFLYEEELILGIRMQQAGWITMYNPNSVILHMHQKTTGGIEKNPFAYICQVCSEIYYCKDYLHMKNIQIVPLYEYRTLIYILKCIRSSQFRKKIIEYLRMTKKALLKN